MIICVNKLVISFTMPRFSCLVSTKYYFVLWNFKWPLFFSSFCCLGRLRGRLGRGSGGRFFSAQRCKRQKCMHHDRYSCNFCVNRFSKQAIYVTTCKWYFKGNGKGQFEYLNVNVNGICLINLFIIYLLWIRSFDLGNWWARSWNRWCMPFDRIIWVTEIYLNLWWVNNWFKVQYQTRGGHIYGCIFRLLTTVWTLKWDLVTILTNWTSSIASALLKYPYYKYHTAACLCLSYEP